jgi:hypothetical protein
MRTYYRTRHYIEDDLYDSDVPLLPSLTVCDHIGHDTGLLDSEGFPIMRASRPIGFGRDKDWF